MNILAYVQLRNIYGSTGAGRFARQITEHMAQIAEDQIHILADPLDHQKVVHKVGAPWDEFFYHFFAKETSAQQARWALTGNPKAEHYWPEAQIVYCTNESYVPTRKCRLVVTLHDMALLEKALPRSSWLFKQQLKKRFLCRILSRKADLVHTVSHFSSERIAHFFPGLKARLRVVYNAVSARFFLPVSTQGEEFLKASELANRPFVLVPGGLHYRKNAELVLKAWPLIHQLHPETILVVSGHCAPNYERRAEALGASIKLTRFVSDDVLCSLYHAAQVVWFPSRYEGFGMPIIEAMACGTPVVTSNSTSMPEVAGNAAMLASPAVIAEQVEAVDALLNDSGKREDFAKRGKARAQQFTWHHSAAQLRQHFLCLI